MAFSTANVEGIALAEIFDLGLYVSRPRPCLTEFVFCVLLWVHRDSIPSRPRPFSENGIRNTGPRSSDIPGFAEISRVAGWRSVLCRESFRPLSFNDRYSFL